MKTNELKGGLAMSNIDNPDSDSNKLSQIPKLAFTIAEAAFSTGASERTLQFAVSRGEISAKRVGRRGPGRRILIPARELERWVNSEAPGTPDEAEARAK